MHLMMPGVQLCLSLDHQKEEDKQQVVHYQG